MSTTACFSWSSFGLLAAVCLSLSAGAQAAPRSERFKPAHKYMDCSPVRAAAQVASAPQPVVAAPQGGQRAVALPCSRKPAR